MMVHKYDLQISRSRYILELAQVACGVNSYFYLADTIYHILQRNMVVIAYGVF